MPTSICLFIDYQRILLIRWRILMRLLCGWIPTLCTDHKILINLMVEVKKFWHASCSSFYDWLRNRDYFRSYGFYTIITNWGTRPFNSFLIRRLAWWYFDRNRMIATQKRMNRLKIINTAILLMHGILLFEEILTAYGKFDKPKIWLQVIFPNFFSLLLLLYP